MSLIHEALKKAELGKNPSLAGREFIQSPIIPDKQKTSKTIFLVILLSLSLLLLIYLRFVKKPSPSAIPTPLIPESVVRDPQDPLVLKKLALNLFNEGKLEQSLAAWQRLTLFLSTDPEVYNNMGFTLKKLGKKEEAYQAYTKALALQRNYPEALNNLGVLYLGDGERQKAKSYFQEALQNKNDYPDPHLNLGVLFEQEGNLKTAQEHYIQFLRLSTAIDPALKEKIQKKVDLLAP